MHLFFCTDMKADIKSNNEIISDIVSGYYTFSCDLKTNAQNLYGLQFRLYTDSNLSGAHIDIPGQLTPQADDQWHKVKLYLNIPNPIKWKYENGAGCNNCKVGFGFTVNLKTNTYYEIKRAKLELGRVDNPIWTPSPADISLIYDRLAKVAPAETMSEPVADIERPE